MPQIRLDDEGNPIEPIRLDDNGEPINELIGDTVSNVKMNAPSILQVPVKKGMFDTFMEEYPRIRQIGQKLLTGTTPEYDAAMKAEGLKKYPPGGTTTRKFGRIDSNDEIRKYYGKTIGSPLKEESILPDIGQPESYWGGFANSLYNDFIRPIATPSGFIGSSGPKVLPKKQLLLGPGRDDFIGGPTGATGQVTKSKDLTDIAAIEGKTVKGKVVGADPKALDLERLREEQKLKEIYYTQHENQGGSALEIKDGILMDIPPQSGDTRLGFREQTNADLEYPLNVVPNRLRPRIAQSVQRALHGDVSDNINVPKEKITFESPKAVQVNKEIKKDPTRAIEPGEEILPSAHVTLRKNADGTNSPIENPTIKFDNDGKVITGPISKLLSALKEARPLTKAQAAIYSAEKGKRVDMAESVETKGLKGHYERMGMLSGKHTKIQMEPVLLDAADVDELVDTINNYPTLMRYGKENATTGLTKVLAGQVPQKNEIDLLERVFGKANIDEMRAILPTVDNKRSNLMEIVNLPRAIQSSYDLSFPFRQGLGLIHTKGWWSSWGAMVKSYGDEKVYRGVIDSILDRPNYQPSIDSTGKVGKSFAQRAGLILTDLYDMTNREEIAMSNWAEKVPGVRPSNRAYTAFANKLRADNFDRLILNAEKIYESAKKTAKPEDLQSIEMLNPRYNIEVAKKLAEFVNNASGRGSLGALESSAVGLNTVLFSPRLMASRIHMLNPKNYISNSLQVRKEYLKSMIAMATTWATVASISKAAGAEVSFDSNSSDFMKIKFGNTRLDPMGGFQQYLVLASRLTSGEYTTGSDESNEYGKGFGGKSRGTALADFVRNKLAPVPAYGAGLSMASEYRPFDIVDKSARLFTPILLQDLSEITQEDPDLLSIMVPAALGMGTQSYGDREESKLFGNSLPTVSFEGGKLW